MRCTTINQSKRGRRCVGDEVGEDDAEGGLERETGKGVEEEDDDEDEGEPEVEEG